MIAGFAEGMRKLEQGRSRYFFVTLHAQVRDAGNPNGVGSTLRSRQQPLMPSQAGVIRPQVVFQNGVDELSDDAHSLNRWFLPDQTHTPDMYVLTGYDGDTEPFLIKVIVTGGTVARLYMSYPQKEQAHYDPLVIHVRDSFSFTAVSNTVPQPLPIIDAGPSDIQVPISSAEAIARMIEAGVYHPRDGGKR